MSLFWITQKEDYNTLPISGEPKTGAMTTEDLYEKLCHKYGVIPIKSFMKQMQQKHLYLAYHSLGPEDAKALAAPLQVVLVGLLVQEENEKMSHYYLFVCFYVKPISLESFKN